MHIVTLFVLSLDESVHAQSARCLPFSRCKVQGCVDYETTKARHSSHLIVAAVLVVISAIQWRARLCVNLARLQAQVPNFRILFNLLSFVITQAAAVLLEHL